MGSPLAGIEVEVVDDQGQALPERRVGGVMVRAPSLMSGTVEDGELIPRRGEWLDTGDLGYLAEGELYVTGRRKDIIIKNGRNYSPDRAEELACLAAEARRAVAFGVFDEAKVTERFVLMVEAAGKELNSADRRDRKRLAIRAALQAAGYNVDEIRFAPKGSLPRTSSGKIRRQRCRELYLDGSLNVA